MRSFCCNNSWLRPRTTLPARVRSCSQVSSYYYMIPKETQRSYMTSSSNIGSTIAQDHRQHYSRRAIRLSSSLHDSTRTRTVPRASFSTPTTAGQRNPIIHDIFEPKTGTWQYIVADPCTRIANIIDPVLDYDPATQAISTQTADSLLDLIKRQGYTIERILETHVHADHLTAAAYLQNRLAAQEKRRRPPLIGLGKRIVQVQTLFRKRYGVPATECEGVFDTLFDDDEDFSIGGLTATAIHLPGHTPDHMGYKIGGKTLSMSRLEVSSPLTLYTLYR